MIIDKASVAAKEYNEDGYIIDEEFVMVLDGATSLEKTSLFPSAGAYLVDQIKKRLPLLEGSIMSRLDIIAKDIYKELFEDVQVKDSVLPSAALAWVEFDNETVTVHIIGDCEVAIVTKKGNINRIVNEELSRLDNIAIKEMIEVSKKEHISIKEARERINDTLIKNRLLMNKEDGYSIFSPSENPNFRYTTTTLNKNDIKELYLYSDGFADAFETFNLYSSVNEMFSKEMNIHEVINQIIKIANEDDEYNNFPRFKLVDDITVIKVKM